MCDITINEGINDMCEKKMNMKDVVKMKRCIVRLSRTKPERPFKMSEGFMKNVLAARAASETAGNAHNPESSSQLKGTKKSSKRTKTKESVRTNNPPREWREINQRLFKIHVGANLP